MFKVRTVSRLALFFSMMSLASLAVAAEKMSPSGKVSIESTSIAAGIGVSWGDGKLSFKGKQVSFSVDGLSLVDFGISKASAVGDVYNLTDVSKFEGSYVAAEAGFALAGGMGGMVLRNQNGVVMHLRSVSRGAKLQLGTSGLVIKLKQ
ncbi:MAG TPA: EipA family protein [Candidatus Binatia bacterium]